MTIFGWDASHYDGDLDVDRLRRARAEGIEFFTHKIGEGLSNTDTTATQALAAARDAGLRAVGGYYFIHSGDMVAQARRCVSLADRYVPWWRTFGGWFWQTDAETDTGGHLPSPAEVKLFSDTLAALSRRWVVVYASHGMYGDRLTGLGHPLWNANYPSDRAGGFKELYPGDRYAGWTDYSGQTPVIAQYTSSATIAGLTTCDANAFRGTIDQLLDMIGGDNVAGFDANDAHYLLTYRGLPAAEPTESLGTAVMAAQAHATSADGKLDTLAKTVADQGVVLQQILTLLTSAPPPSTGGTVELSPAGVAAVADATADELHDRMAG